jgi:Secretion system C-terminal sorting domain
MKRFILGLAIAAIAASAVAANAAPPQVILGPGTGAPARTPYCQNFDRVLSADTTYVLTGLYYVEAPHKITIQPGTLILGNQATTGTLIVTRGAQIFAQGTVNHPIVFTSAFAPGSRNPGDWGGIIILGGAPTNKVDPVIEGGIISGSCGGGSGTYGGANANDNSGILSYIRIEYAGYRFQVNNEINGLTMGGVGAGTQIDHIQVSYSLDDSYEWFGGTVNCKYLVCYGGTDDEQDTDFGFSGHVQFVLGLRDPDYWDTTGQSNGFESDNDGTSTSTDNPHTHAIFSNVTLIGPERNNAEVPFPLASTAQYGALLRRSTQECVYNSVIMGYPWNLAVRDATTQGFATGGQLQIRYDSFQATTIPSGSSTTLEHSTWAGIEAWFATAGFNNINSNAAVRQPDTIKLNDMSNLNNPDPRPQTTSELVGSADFTNANLTDPFFTPVTYRGAFPPVSQASKQSIWTAYWTNFDPQNTNYSNGLQVTAVGGPSISSKLGQNYPNPFNPQTSIDYTIGQEGKVTLDIFNASGAKVRTLVSGVKKAGSYTANFNADGMASGVYFYRLIAPGINEYKKMVLLK